MQPGIIEKRWSERRQIGVSVDVVVNDQVLATCNSRDIGLGGTCLNLVDAEQASSSSLAKDMDVNLIFHLQGSKEFSDHTIGARVARVNDDSVGFKFCDFDTDVFRSLQEIMAYRRHNQESGLIS